MIDFHEAALAERRLRVAVRGDATVAIDEPLFKRAISNLLGNAIRFADPGSEIVVQFGAGEPGEIRILVQNRGLEIEPSHLPRLFDRFFRAESSRRTEGQVHHGLGLAIVAAIARMHSGRTFAHSFGGVTRLGFTVAAR